MNTGFKGKMFLTFAVLQSSLLSLARAEPRYDSNKDAVREWPASKKWAILVGVDDYANVKDLQFCGQDGQKDGVPR